MRQGLCLSLHHNKWLGGIVKGRATARAELQLTLMPLCGSEHNERVCLAKRCVGHGLWLDQDIEGDLCQGLKDPVIRDILKYGSWNAITSGQPLKGLQLTCLGKSG